MVWLAVKPPTPNIERASSASLRGLSLQSALRGVKDLAIRINRANVEAVRFVVAGPRLASGCSFAKCPYA